MAKDRTRINGQIRSKEVRVVVDNGDQLGVLSIDEALQKAEELGLDLVEVSPNADPPVCRIIDYGKFKYEKTKKDKENKKKQKQVVIKEIRIKPRIDSHDKETKLSQIKKFLSKEYKIKVSLRLVGREKAHAEIGIKILDDIANELEELAVIEKNYGKNQIQKFIMLTPKKM